MAETKYTLTIQNLKKENVTHFQDPSASLTPNFSTLLLMAFLLIFPPLVNSTIKRSAAAKAEFRRQSVCPATGLHKGRCPGYVIDHINPLACSGADSPENMQWQTISDAKAKDKWERKNCNKNAEKN